MEESPRVPKARAGLASTPSRPATAGRRDRGLCRAPPGDPKKTPARFLRWLLPSSPQPVAQRPSHAFYLALAQTSGSGTAAASLSTADAETPLSSSFPEAPCAGCFRSAGPRRRGEAKPHVAMEMCSGWGRGCPTTMTALRFGLA